ncbi:MAG: PKD domain-containing protein [Saprospiraceae bacterium]
MIKWVFIFVLLPQLAFAQMHDNTWLFGNKNDTILDNERGIQILTFQDGNIKIEQNTQLMRFNFWETNTSFSDSSGSVLSYSNAVHIGNSAWEIMENGDSLTNALEAGGELWCQWILCLPWPEHDGKHIYFYEQEGFTSTLSFHATNLYYAIVDMSYNMGLGKVTERDVLVIEDTLAVGKVNAVKHANGRDWWVMVNEKNSNRWYRLLFDPNGIHVLGSQTIGVTVYDGVGQSVFTPNGEHFALYNGISTALGSYIDLYDFDRCEGLFYNHSQYHFFTGDWGGGAFSPNSRYLYINYFTKAYQYDLEAPDIWASRVQVAEYDGYLDPFFTTFYNMQLAPDGKIYSSSTNSVSSLHVIHNPDEPGEACQYQQHGIELPTRNTFSMPTFPNYRLGPLDGSTCDTLGLDNLPISWWRYEQDTLDPLLLAFHDLSYYEPTSWAWDFGDPNSGLNNTNMEQHPNHIFSAPGEYHVCLTISNSNASNTLCRTLQLGNTIAENPEIQERIQVTPNPFRNHLSIALSANLRSPVFNLYDQMGRLILKDWLGFGITEIETSSLPPGMYFWELRAMGETVKAGKCVKVQE